MHKTKINVDGNPATIYVKNNGYRIYAKYRNGKVFSIFSLDMKGHIIKFRIAPGGLSATDMLSISNIHLECVKRIPELETKRTQEIQNGNI